MSTTEAPNPTPTLAEEEAWFDWADALWDNEPDLIAHYVFGCLDEDLDEGQQDYIERNFYECLGFARHEHSEAIRNRPASWDPR